MSRGRRRDFDVNLTIKLTDGQPVEDVIQKIHIGLNFSSADSLTWSEFSDTLLWPLLTATKWGCHNPLLW